MDIGLFQLENLLYTHTRFCFLDLREAVAAVENAALKPLIARAERVPAEKVEGHLNETQIAKEAPIVLLCENGRSSAAVSQRLEKSGYKNVYVVEGGVEALLLEL